MSTQRARRSPGAPHDLTTFPCFCWEEQEVAPYPGEMERLPKVNFAQLEHREMISTQTGERYSRTAILSEALHLRQLFVHHEVLPPGRRASAPHWHTQREEVVVVLAGRPTAHFGGHSERLQTGDVLAFASGTEIPHCLENQTDERVELLVVASLSPHDQTITPR